jgi:iron complex outermembrane receptor protein
MNNKLFTLIACCSFALSAVAETISESEEVANIDEVVLTGREETAALFELEPSANSKFLASVTEIPRTIDIITSDQFTERGALSVQDSLGYTAGVYAGPYGMDSRLDSAKIRGINPLKFQDGFQSHVGFYNTTRPDVFTVESVEVIQGPASVLYGQGAVGGIINTNSKLPKAEFGGEINFQYGEHDRHQAAVDVTGPIDDEGTLLYRIVGLVRNADTQVDHVQDDARIFMPSFTWQPTDATSLTFLLNLQENDGGSTFQFLPLQDQTLKAQNLDVDPEIFIGEPGWDRYDTKQTAFSVFFEHEINDIWSVSLNGRYAEGDADYRYHQGLGPETAVTLFLPPLPAGKIYRLAYISDANLEVLSGNAIARAEFKTGELQHRFQVGVDYVDSTRNDDRPNNGFLPRGYYFGGGPFTPTVIDLENPVYSGDPVRADLNGKLESSLEQVGLFVGDVVRYENWIFSGAARYDWVKEASKSGASKSSADNEELTLEGGVMYQFENGISPYYSFAEAFQANDVDQNGDIQDVRTGDQHELGIKYQSEGGNMMVSLALFDIEEQNRAEGTINTVLIDATYQGIELQSAYRWQDFTLNLAYSYTDAKQGDGDLYVPQVPQILASAWIGYAVADGYLKGFRAGLGARYADETHSLRNTAESESFTVFDAMLGYSIRNWDFQVNALNLFNKEYKVAVSDIDELLPAVAYGQSRFVNFTSSYSF